VKSLGALMFLAVKMVKNYVINLTRKLINPDNSDCSIYISHCPSPNSLQKEFCLG